MRKIVITLAIMLVAGGVTLGWWFLQKQSAPIPANKLVYPASESKKDANPKEHSYTDVDFARKMIVHDQQGIQMADIAKRISVNEEIRQLAASMSEELTKDTEKYIDWLTEWNETYSNLSDFPQMEGHDMYPTHPGMASLTDLRALESTTGDAFDELFLRLMIAHHEGANEMANDNLAFKDIQFGQMINLKDEVLKRQTEEMQTMKQLQAKGE